MPATSAFFTAIEAGDVAGVRAMLDSEPGLLAQSSTDGASAALTALYAGHRALADELAARSGQLSIFEAAAFDDTERLAELIRADRSAVAEWSSDGWQPLHLAAYFGRVEAARALLDADAPVGEVSRNAMAVQPLHAAAAGRHGEMVWILIASDADVAARQQHGWTPLHSAAANGDLESVQALLSAGADPHVPNDDGVTPQDLAESDEVKQAFEAG